METDWGFWGFWVGLAAFVFSILPYLQDKRSYWQTELHEDEELRRETAAKLRGGGLGATYRDSLQRALSWLDRVFGESGSMQALEVCILIAIAYAYVSFFLGWSFGGAGDIGSYTFLPDSVGQAERIVSTLIILIAPLAAFFGSRRLARAILRRERRFKARLLRLWRNRKHGVRSFNWLYRLSLALLVLGILGGWLGSGLENKMTRIWFISMLIFLFTLWGGLVGLWISRHIPSPSWRGVAAFVIGSVVGAGTVAVIDVIEIAVVVVVAGTLAVAVAGVIAIAVAGTVAGVIAIAVAGTEAVVGAGDGDGIVAGVLALSFSGGIGTLLGSVRHAENTRGIWAGVLGGGVGLGVLTSFSGKQLADELTLFLLLFFFVLPIANGCFDWLSWWATRALGRRLHELLAAQHNSWRRALTIAGHGLADLAIAVALLLSMAYALALGFEGYNELAKLQTHKPVFEGLRQTIATAADHPGSEGFWLTAMLLTTLLPTFGHGVMLLGSPLSLVFLPDRKRQELASMLDGYASAANQVYIRRNVATWIARGQLLNHLAAFGLLIWLLGRFAAFGFWLQYGGLSQIIANAAYLGVDTAEWFGRAVLGN